MEKKIQIPKKRKKLRKIILLCLVNTAPIPICLISEYSLGYIVYIMAIMCQFVLIWLNYYYIRTRWKMCVMDGISICVTAAGIFGGHLLYQRNISNDYEGVLVFQLFLLLFLVFSTFAVLLAMARAFHRDGYRRSESVTCGVLGVGIAVFLFYSYLAVTPFTYEYVSTVYNNTGEIVHNEQYVGELDYGAVKITTRKGEKVSSVSEEKLGIEAEQIALGENYYYLLGSGTLVKLDYHSRILARRNIGKASSLTCRNGYLFIGTYADEEGYAISMIESFYANQYLAESEFETGKIKPCRADFSGKCLVAGVTLYSHEGKYFSTNPYLPGYPEINSYIIQKDKGVETKEKTVWTDLVETMLREKGLGDYSNRVDEYQRGDYLYGVVNVQKNFFGFTDKKLKCSIAYRISCPTKKIEVLKEMPDRYMILTTDTCVICQDKSKLIRVELSSEEENSSGSERELAEVSDAAYAYFSVHGDYIAMTDSMDGLIYVRWKENEGVDV